MFSYWLGHETGMRPSSTAAIACSASGLVETYPLIVSQGLDHQNAGAVALGTWSACGSIFSKQLGGSMSATMRLACLEPSKCPALALARAELASRSVLTLPPIFENLRAGETRRVSCRGWLISAFGGERLPTSN